MKPSNYLIKLLITLTMLFMAIMSQNTPPPPPPLTKPTTQQPPSPSPQQPPPQGGREILNIVVPVTAYKEYVNHFYDNITGKSMYEGYSIQVFKAAINSIYSVNPPTINFSIYAIKDGTRSQGTFDDMMQAVANQEYDGAVGDTSIRFKRMQWVDFTLPYSETGISMMVLTSNKQSNKSTGIKLMSLIKGLVYGAFGLCLASAFIFWYFEFRNDRRTQQSHTPALGSNNRSLQRSNNDDFWRRETLRAITHTRLVIVMWFLILLFLASCYTASLTSLLTSQRSTKIHNRTIYDLIRNKANVGVLNGSFIIEMLKEKGFSENQINPYNSEQEIIDMLSKGSDLGGIDAVIDEIAYLKVFLSKHCNQGYTLVSSFDIQSEGFAFAFQKGSHWTNDVSRGIMEILDNGTLTEIQKKDIG